MLDNLFQIQRLMSRVLHDPSRFVHAIFENGNTWNEKETEGGHSIFLVEALWPCVKCRTSFGCGVLLKGGKAMTLETQGWKGGARRAAALAGEDT